MIAIAPGGTAEQSRQLGQPVGQGVGLAGSQTGGQPGRQSGKGTGSTQAKANVNSTREMPEK